MLNWENVRLFLAVARASGLAGAAAATQLSAPTLGRRILALERELGVKLFDRHRLGYDLTTVGQEFFERSRDLELGAVAIERWRTAIDPRPVVKIAAGAWTSSFIAQHLERILPANPPVRIEIVTGISFLDIAKREVNLGIRNEHPHQTGLACRNIGQVDFAIYGAPSYVDATPQAVTEDRYEACNWVTLSARSGRVPSLSWLERRMPRPARVTCSSPVSILEAVANNAGLCVLPCFIGETDQRVVRVSETIGELQSKRWLVSHDDDRHFKPNRLVADRIAKLFLAVKQVE